MREINNFGTTGSDLDVGRSLFVHNAVFLLVYYNNGNSLPVFSIPLLGINTTRSETSRTLRRLFSFVHNRKQGSRQGLVWGSACTSVAQGRSFPRALANPESGRHTDTGWSLRTYRPERTSTAGT